MPLLHYITKAGSSTSPQLCLETRQIGVLKAQLLSLVLVLVVFVTLKLSIYRMDGNGAVLI